MKPAPIQEYRTGLPLIMIHQNQRFVGGDDRFNMLHRFVHLMPTRVAAQRGARCETERAGMFFETIKGLVCAGQALGKSETELIRETRVRRMMPPKP